MTEEWRAIPGYEGRYEVSDQGNVRSLRFRNGYTDRPRSAPLLMRVRQTRKGYLRLSLYDFDGVRVRLRTVHLLVMAAFGEPRPTGYQCAHLNGHPADNRFENLRWVTPTENQAHRLLHGTMRCKLTSHQVLAIRAAVDGGEPIIRVAARYGLAWATVKGIVRRKTWRRL